MKNLPRLSGLVLGVGALSLVACSKPADSNAPESTSSTAPTSVATPVVVPDAEAVSIRSLLPTQAYDCLPTQKITATYDQQNPTEPQAMLEINGMIHVLYATSASESLYRSESGMADGEGMTWQVQADGATLTSMPLDANSTPATKILYRCVASLSAVF